MKLTNTTTTQMGRRTRNRGSLRRVSQHTRSCRRLLTNRSSRRISLRRTSRLTARRHTGTSIEDDSSGRTAFEYEIAVLNNSVASVSAVSVAAIAVDYRVSILVGYYRCPALTSKVDVSTAARSTTRARTSRRV